MPQRNDMNKSILSEDRHSYYYIRIQGRFSVAILAELRKIIESATGVGRKQIAFDLGMVTTIDSPALGLIATLEKQLHSSPGGKLCIIAPSPAVTRLLETSGLTKVMSIVNTAAEAETEFQGWLQKTEHGFYVLFQMPEQVNIDIVTPLRKSIDEMIVKDYKHFVFDFAKTKLITSVGIGILMNLQGRMKPLDGGVHVVNLPDEIRSIMEIANVLRIIPEYATLDDVDRELI